MALRHRAPRRWPAALVAARADGARRPRRPRRRARRLRPRAHRVRARRVPARDRDPAPAALPGGAARQRGRGRPGAPHAGRRLPVREQARRGPARVPQAARSCGPTTASTRCWIRSGWSTSSTACSRKRRRRSRRSRSGAASATRSWPPQRERDAARLRLPPTVVRYERHSFAVNFIPFGAGQFQNGQRAQGLAVLRRRVGAGRGVAGGVRRPTSRSTASTPGAQVHRPEQPTGIACPPGSIDHSQEDTSDMLLGVQVVSGGLFFAVAIWGVIDAIRQLPARGAADRHRRHGDGARAPAPRAASHAFARRPRRRLGVLKGNRNHGDTQTRRSPARARRSTASTRRSRRWAAATRPT